MGVSGGASDNDGIQGFSRAAGLPKTGGHWTRGVVEEEGRP